MAKKIVLELTPKQLESLKKIVEYLSDSEGTHFEEFTSEGGAKKDHIFFHTQNVEKVLSSK
jgi:hypothetical protein